MFLFVIMMLNLKSQKEEDNLLQMLFVIFVSFLAVLSTFLIGNIFKTNSFSGLISQIDLNFLTDNLNNIDIFGQILFNYYMSCFLLAGFILLIALVGSIVLTLRFSNTDDGQIVNKQLSRTENFLSFFK